MKKRVLSLVLAIAMLIGLLPTIAFAEGETADVLTYDLTSNALSSRVPSGDLTQALGGDYLRNGTIAYQFRMFDWEYTSSTVAEGDTGEVPFKTLDLTKTAPYAIENTNRKLMGILANNDYSDDKKLNALFITSKYGNASSDRPHIALRLKLDKEGIYNLTLSSLQAVADYTAFAEIWFGKAPETYSAAEIDTAIASSDFKNIGWWRDGEGYFDANVTAENKDEKGLSALTLSVPEAGEYWLIFNFPEKSLALNPTTITVSSQACQYFYLSSMTLKAVEDPEPTAVETNVRKSVQINKEYDFTAKIKMTDASYAAFGGDNTITVTGSDNLTVSNVSASGDTVSFKVKGTALSEAEKLTFAGTVGGKEFSFEKAITVAENEVTNQAYEFNKIITSGVKPIMTEYTCDKDGWEINKNGTCTYLKDTFWKDTAGLYPLGIYAYLRPTPLTYRVMALDFNIEQDGYYDVSMLTSVTSSNDSGWASAYIDGKYVGQVNGIKGTAGDFKLRPLELKAGRHTLFVAVDRSLGGTHTRFAISNLAFKGTATKNELSETKLTFSATSGFAGESITATPSLVFANGAEIPGLTESYRDDLASYNSFKTANGESMTITSSNTDVATVDGTTIKLLSVGTCDITFTATLDGVTKSVTKTIEVVEPVLSEISVAAETGYVLIDDADGVALTVTGTLSDGTPADLSGATITYASSDRSVAIVENGRVIPKSLGDVMITVTVETEVGEFEKEISLVVSEEPIAPSLKLMLKDTKSQATLSNGYFGPNTVGDNWTINKDITDKRYYDGSTAAIRIQGSVQYGYLLDYGDFAIDFETSMDGYYDVELEIITWSSTTGNAKFYIDDKFVGEMSGNKPVLDLYTPTIKLGRPVALDAGTHTLRVCKSGNLFFNGARLTGTAKPTPFSGVEIQTPAKEYAAGESDSFVTKLVWENGAELDVPIYKLDGSVEVDFEVTSSDDSVVAVDGKNYKALKSGTAKLQTSAEFEGSTISGETEITVNNETYKAPDVNLDEEAVYFTEGTKTLETVVVLTDGRITDAKNVSNIHYESSDESIAVIENGVLKTLKEGTVTITAYATFNGEEKSVSKTITVENVKVVSISAATEDGVISILDEDGSKIVVSGLRNDGKTIKLDGDFTYEALTPEIFTVTEDGYAKYASRGVGKVKVAVTIDGTEFTCESELTSSSAKTAPTVYTYEMREIAQKNAKTYDWAKSLKNTAVANADRIVENLDAYYEAIPVEGVPRSYTITTLQSPTTMTYICPHPDCGVSVAKTTGAYSWGADIVQNPWKIQCPNCKRYFPSNDFESFYKLGLTEDGTFDRELALKKNQELVDAGEPGYLVNELYKDIWKNEEYGITEEEAKTWMVDDGFGWSPKDKTYGSTESVKTNPKYAPIAFYMHKFWNCNESTGSIITKALNDLRDAYLYTGEAKYGRAGAILLDRVADVYPDYDITKVSLSYANSHGGGYSGKTVGSIWETRVGEDLTRAYDAFYPMMEDSQVIGYLSKKAVELGLDNPKTNADYIRENAENGILRESFNAVKTAKMRGNYGMHQCVVAVAAAALDTYPETGEMFEWLSKPEKYSYASATDKIYNAKYTSYVSNQGGDMLSRYINRVDRDGFGDEVGIGYNKIWVTEALNVAEVLARYGAETDINLFEHPKYLKMLNSIIKETLGDGYSIQIGDSGGTATALLYSTASDVIRVFNMVKDTDYAVTLAKNYYYTVGGDLDGIYVDIFTDNSSLAKEIQAIIDEYGELEFESENLTGFGLSILRNGEFIPGSGNGTETRGDTWMYWGRTSGHGHRDMLQLGVDAYGFNFMPDLGYPEATGNNENRLQWVMNTLSHNTVVVDNDYQTGIYGGTPYHFDVTDRVQLTDVDAPGAYASTDIYRRTAVQVKASSDVSYTVDFFRIKGGDNHTYSFHTQSYMGYTTDDFELIKQVDENGNYVGSYAGADVSYGPDPNGSEQSSSYTCKYPRGYTWLENVNRAGNLESGQFSVNFKQTDFNKQVLDSNGLNLKYTALNDWIPTEVAITTGYAPRTASNKNVPGLDYMLIQRKGKKLDTLYTSVLQPYKGEEYIDTMESVAAEIKDGTEGKDDIVKAIKVTLKNGRVDYIVYATNNSVTYTVDNEFDFRGFVGVYTENAEGANIYSYVNDGDIIGTTTGTGSYTGTVKSFTKELSRENSITVSFDGEVDASTLAGKYIYVNNTGSSQNGSYRILAAENTADGVVLDLGDVSVIRSYIDDNNVDKGYNYNIAEGQTFRIPVSVISDDAPVFDSVSDNLSTSAGSSLTVGLNAESALGKTVTYSGAVLPRGATVDSESGVVTWKPTSSQVGESGFVITATDSDGRESSISFVVTVYGSTTGGTSGGTGSSGADSAGTTGTGSAGTGSSSDSGSTSDSGATTPSTGDTTGSGTTGTDNTSEVRFMDLGAHTWAADSINALADDGIIKGTTAKTYSPAANITRADFALLLVRAFELSSENSENFDDVAASEYFAAELAIARNTGIVNGIGDNKYDPRNTITRQDMMTIVYRALTKLDVELTTGDVEYSDYDKVADYAQEAVKALITSGLVNGKSGKIAPNDYTTRAEVAVLLKRILDYTAK